MMNRFWRLLDAVGLGVVIVLWLAFLAMVAVRAWQCW